MPQCWQHSGCHPLHPCIAKPGEEETHLSQPPPSPALFFPLGAAFTRSSACGRGFLSPPLVSWDVAYVLISLAVAFPFLDTPFQACLSSSHPLASPAPRAARRRRGADQQGQCRLLSSLAERACLARVHHEDGLTLLPHGATPTKHLSSASAEGTDALFWQRSFVAVHRGGHRMGARSREGVVGRARRATLCVNRRLCGLTVQEENATIACATMLLE